MQTTNLAEVSYKLDRMYKAFTEDVSDEILLGLLCIDFSPEAIAQYEIEWFMWFRGSFEKCQ